MKLKNNRRWIRFSLRSLLLLAFVAGIYFACGPSTKANGAKDVAEYQRANHLHQITPTYVAPLLLSCWVSTENPVNRTTTTTYSYYIWLFGYVARLPFEYATTVDST
ncbi:MAG: hypothetical protein AAF664_21360 [Planctomycetota bacterium]